MPCSYCQSSLLPKDGFKTNPESLRIALPIVRNLLERMRISGFRSTVDALWARAGQGIAGFDAAAQQTRLTNYNREQSVDDENPRNDPSAGMCEVVVQRESQKLTSLVGSCRRSS